MNVIADLLSRVRQRVRQPNEIDPPLHLANDPTDHSSMADLVRLLREHDREGTASDQA